MLSHEDELLERAIAGDSDSLAELLAHHAPAVRRRLAGKIDTRWQSVLSEEDILQETFTDVFLGISRFCPKGEGAFLRWVLTLARNNLLDAVKGLSSLKKGGKQQRQDLKSSGDSYIDLLHQLGGTITSPSMAVVRVESQQLLLQAIDQLADLDALVVRLYDLDGQPIDEVARRLNCSRGAVFMRRARALAKLRELLGESSCI
jgi:RNA polymerase sigma factor (sigma-70 family)